MTNMIRTSGLVKRYGKVVALDGLDLEVPKGSVLALLGPNGAGKTTAVRILTTLLDPDAGTAEVAGLDVTADPTRVRERIGLSGQTAAVDEHLTGYENLDMVGRLYHMGRKRSRARARELLEQFELSEAGDRPVKTYSGGMRRRLDLAAALVGRPPVLFLDEPTTGLDPWSRSELWRVIAELVDSGSTVLLTTQYLEEADRLCHDVAIIDHGRIVARGAPQALKASIGNDVVTVEVGPERLDEATRVLAGLHGVTELRPDGSGLTLFVTEGSGAVAEAVRLLDRAKIPVGSVAVSHPTLDEVFLRATGSRLEGADVDGGEGP